MNQLPLTTCCSCIRWNCQPPWDRRKPRL